MYRILIVVISFSIFSCKAQENSIQKAIATGVFEGVPEPTKHEETEFYKPVPPTVFLVMLLFYLMALILVSG